MGCSDLFGVDMSIWKPTSSLDEPQTDMNRWIIAKVKRKDRDDFTYHVVGDTYEARVSSSIKQWLPEERIAITNSGRRYFLPEDAFNTPGSDARYVFLNWLAMYGAKWDEVEWLKEPIV